MADEAPATDVPAEEAPAEAVPEEAPAAPPKPSGPVRF